MPQHDGRERDPSAGEAEILGALRSELEREYSEENAEDVALLRRLWEVGHEVLAAESTGEGSDDEAAPSFERRGPGWTALGFQGEDPVSDFRGGGMLAVRNLVAFLERQPGYAGPMLASRRPGPNFDPEKPGFYPWAAAGINATRAVADVAGLCGPSAPKKLACWPLLVADTRAFDECYAICFRLVDRIFDERAASYMEFNAVLAQAKAALTRGLADAGEGHAAQHYLPQRVDPREPCPHDALCAALGMAPPGWGCGGGGGFTTTTNKSSRRSRRNKTASLQSARAAGATPENVLADVVVTPRQKQPCGPLEKLPVSGVHRKFAAWKKRYFALHGDLVVWFRPSSARGWAKAEVNGELTNYVRICADSAVVENHTSGDPLAFKLERCRAPDGKLGKLRLRAERSDDRDRWVRALRDAVDAVASGVSSAPGRRLDPAPAVPEPDDALDEAVLLDRRRSSDPRGRRTALSAELARDDDDDDDFDAAAKADDDDDDDTVASSSLPVVDDPGSNTRRRLFRFPRRRSGPSAVVGAQPSEYRDMPTRASKRLSFRGLGRSSMNLGVPQKNNPPVHERSADSTAWISCADDHNNVYYVHRPSGRTQWDLPPGWTSSTSGWAARIDKDTGHTYYFFASTGQVTWVLPDNNTAR